MRRILAGFIVIVLAVAASVYLADRPGTVTMVWQGWRIDTSVAVLGLGAALVIFILTWLATLLRRIFRAPSRFLRARKERRRRDGYRALTQGMAAVAAGDPDEAERCAKRANNLLSEPPLTLLLSAQAAQLKGDEDAARRYFTAMLESPETEFMGLRGLLMQALHRGEEGVAKSLVDRARDVRPRAPWVLRMRVELAARAGQWDEAEAALAEAAKRKALPPEELRHHRAAILHEKGRVAAAANRPAETMKLARAASEAAPGFVPGTLRYAELQQAQGGTRGARKAIESAWRAQPHPELAAAYQALYTDESALERIPRLERLREFNPAQQGEAHVALARLSLEARLWGEARRHLRAAGVDDPDQASPRLYRLMAAIEQAEHGDNVAAQDWLERAASAAAPDPAYACNNCGHVTPHWSVLCPRCRSFDQLVWRRRPGGGDVLADALPPAGVGSTALSAYGAEAQTIL